MILTKKILPRIVACLLIGFVMLANPNYVQAQEKERVRLKAYYEKLSNDDKKISMILTRGSGKDITGVQNSEILLSTLEEEEQKVLASLITDSNGEAFLFVEAGYSFPKDENGYAVINAKFNGNDSLNSASKEIMIRDLNIEISFEIIDSVKHVTILAFEKDSAGNRIPVSELGLKIGVERLYSNLFFDKTETDVEGKGTMEFPDDIPGDSEGIIMVVVLVEDHDDFGTVTKSKPVNWGTLVDYSDRLIGRSLFGEHAPLWMIIAVIIILAGAWYHFILAISKVTQIRSFSHASEKYQDVRSHERAL